MPITTSASLGGNMIAENQEIEAFLSDWAKIKIGERPELQAGFRGLRRAEINKLCRDYKIDWDENLPKERMIPILETYWHQGRFPKPKSQDERLAERILASLSPEALEALAAQKRAKQSNQPTPIDADKDQETIGALRKKAKEMGINSWGKTRVELEAEIAAKEQAA